MGTHITRKLEINDIVVSDESKAFVIAEIGHNHQGSVETCKKMFKAAAESGATAVKLQKRNNKELFTKEFYDSPYNSENAFGPTYGSHREALEFNFEDYQELKSYAESLGVIFFSTAFDFSSVDFLVKLGVPLIKMASGDLKSTPLLKYAASTGIPLIISTGGANLKDVQIAYEAIKSVTDTPFAILQCTAAYPAGPEILNLNVIKTYRNEFQDAVIGFSAHDLGIAMGPAAYALGARIFEKHFTLDRSMKGTDHAFSLEPIGMKKYVRDLNNVASALGDGVKNTLEIELAPLKKMSKKIVIAEPVEKGERLTLANLMFMSPGDGISPADLHLVENKVATRSLEKGETLSLEDCF
jgi:N-acetylneuraminate synthase/sialic acid synthase